MEFRVTLNVHGSRCIVENCVNLVYMYFVELVISLRDMLRTTDESMLHRLHQGFKLFYRVICNEILISVESGDAFNYNANIQPAVECITSGSDTWTTFSS